MRILEVVPHVGNEASGPTYSVVALSRALASAGHSVDLMSALDGQLQPEQGFRHVVYPKAPWPSSLWRSPEMARALRQTVTRYDVVHVSGMWVMPAVYPGVEARRASVPVVSSPRGSLSPEALRRSGLRKQLFWRLFHRASFQNSRCIHATSEQEFRDIRSFGLTVPVAIIPNGVDIPSVPVWETKGRREPVVLFLGRIHPIKGLDTLLGAWKVVKSRPGVSDWRLRIVGPSAGDYADTLRRMTIDLAIPQVDFEEAAFGEAKWRAYASASLTVLPSRSENFGMTVAESLASATPVVASQHTPWEGLVRERCGWWPRLDEDALACALDDAMRMSAASREEMGERGREWVRRSFSWDGIAGQMANLFTWIVGGGSSPDCVRLE